MHATSCLKGGLFRIGSSTADKATRCPHPVWGPTYHLHHHHHRHRRHRRHRRRRRRHHHHRHQSLLHKFQDAHTICAASVLLNNVGRGGALGETMTFNRMVVGSTPALAATQGP